VSLYYHLPDFFCNDFFAKMITTIKDEITQIRFIMRKSL